MDVNSVCRTCLKENAEMKSIYCDDPTNSLSQMIAACTVTTVSAEDGLPSQICLQCIENVKISYIFKQQCESSYETLKNVFGTHIDSMDEPEKLMDTSSDQDIPSELLEIHNNMDTESFGLKNLGPNEKCIQTEEICFYPCEMCESKFINEDALKVHRILHKESGFKCRVCTKTYSRLTHLRRHIGATHPDFVISKALDDIICSICNKQFTRMEHLRRHMTLHLHEEKPPASENTFASLKCEDCHKIFVNDLDYQNHTECKKEESYQTENKVEQPDIINDQPEMNSLDDMEIQSVKDEKFSDDGYDDHDADEAVSNELETNENNDSTSTEDEAIMPGKIKRPRGRPKKAAKNNIKKETFSCEICKREFKNANKFENHKLLHDRTPKIHKCTSCDKTFTRATHLKRHLVTHAAVKPYGCELCGKKFSRIDHLNIHRHHHSDVKPHNCDVCQKGFTRAEHLRKHKEGRHGEKPTAIKSEFCEICKKGFTTPKYLQVHMRTHSDRLYNCKFCDVKFGSKADLNEHLKIHVNERPFLCSECGLRFVRNDYLVIHMRRHKGEKPYKCKYCGKGFPRATDLTVHERYHTGEKTHLCTICGKGFQRAYNLLVHTRVHTGERPYQCPHCVKSFAQGNDLKAHVRRHTGERYKCEVCGDGFIQGYHLTQHKRNVHGIDMKSHIRRVEKFVPITQAHQLQELQQFQQMQQIQHLHRLQQEADQQLADIKIKTQDLEPDNSQPNIEQLTQEIKIEPTIVQVNEAHINDSHSSDVPIINTHAQAEHSTLVTTDAHLLDDQSSADLSLPHMSMNLYPTMHPKFKLPQSFE